MNISNAYQLSLTQIYPENIDIIICSSGYESRSSYLIKKLNFVERIKNKVAFGFKNDKDILARPQNDSLFQKKGFTLIEADGDCEDEILEFINSAIQKINKDSITILIDYSSMTRVWYASILQFFCYNDLKFKHVNINFSYSLARYNKSPNGNNFNIHIGPIRGYTSISVPQKPTALVIGLGYEKNRAAGLNEYFDGETFLFYTDADNDNTHESKYSKEVFNKNQELIDKTKKENIYVYSIDDLDRTYKLLSSLCQDLLSNYRIIIAPCGPKPFTLISLLIALSYENIDVWRISSGKESVPVDKKPAGEVMCFNIEFKSD